MRPERWQALEPQRQRNALRRTFLRVCRLLLPAWIEEEEPSWRWPSWQRFQAPGPPLRRPFDHDRDRWDW